MKKLIKSTPFKLSERIKVRDFQVSSMTLYQSKFARLTLVSMGKEEEISAETMPNPRFFYLLRGDVEIKLSDEFLKMKKEALVHLPSNSFYSVNSLDDSIYLEIEYLKGEDLMETKEIKTIEHLLRGQTFLMKEEISYEEEQIVSKNLVANQSMVMTLMAFAKGESLAPHKAPGDALIFVLDGEAKFIIDGKESIVKAGENIVLPGNILHAVDAIEAFKMLLIIVK